MSEQSPVTSSDAAEVSSTLLACDYLKQLVSTRAVLEEFLAWMLSDPDGNLSSDFKLALVNQMLFDASKKGYFVKSSETTGYLELVNGIDLADLDGESGTDRSLLMLFGGTWVKTAQIYAAPTSGGTTVPDANGGGLLSVAHGLGFAPNQFGVVLECNADDALVNYVTGDRVAGSSLMFENAAATEVQQAMTVNANATTIFARFRDGAAANADYQLFDSAFTRQNIDPTKWNVKFWALP